MEATGGPAAVPGTSPPGGSTASSGVPRPLFSGEERCPKRPRLNPVLLAPTGPATEIFGGTEPGVGRLYLGAQTATVEWRIGHFGLQQQRVDGVCLDGPKFGPRDPWQVFCHPDGRCFNQPQGGPPGVFLRYLGPHERVPAYATIEKLVDGEFRVPENNARDAPFVVLFGRSEIEEWGVCKDFGLFDDAFGRGLVEETLVLRARVTWVEPRNDSLLPREVISVRRNAVPSFARAEGSLQAELGALWNTRRTPGGAAARSPAASGGPAVPGVPVASVTVPADLVLLCEQQRFEADRAILAARSAYFGNAFSNRQLHGAGQSGGQPREEIELPGLSARALAAALRFVYTDEGSTPQSREEAEELLVAASTLRIAGMRQMCSDHLRDVWLTRDSAVGLLRLADEHGAMSLRTEALAVIGANFDQVKTTPEWEDLLHHINPALIQDTMQAVADASVFAGRASIKL